MSSPSTTPPTMLDQCSALPGVEQIRAFGFSESLHRFLSGGPITDDLESLLDFIEEHELNLDNEAFRSRLNAIIRHGELLNEIWMGVCDSSRNSKTRSAWEFSRNQRLQAIRLKMKLEAMGGRVSAKQAHQAQRKPR